jgi:hypothetical protein
VAVTAPAEVVGHGGERDRIGTRIDRARSRHGQRSSLAYRPAEVLDSAPALVTPKLVVPVPVVVVFKIPLTVPTPPNCRPRYKARTGVSERHRQRVGIGHLIGHLAV